MLMYGPDNESTINIKMNGDGVMYNLTSLREGYITLSSLIPPNSIGRFTDRDFDIAYAQYIINNDNVFCEFFQIIYNLYINKNIFIMYNANENWSENIMESLLKLIQQRYGINALFIETEEDYMYFQNYNVATDFAPGYGLYNLDQDKERFTYLMESFRLTNHGNLPYYLEGFVIDEHRN